MSRTPELSAVQREKAVKLVRGAVLEYEGSSVLLAAALRKKGFESPGQQAISGIMHRYVNSGKAVASHIAEFLGLDFFSDQPVIYGDLPGWSDAERKAKESHRGAAFAPSSYFAVRHRIIKGKQPKITPKVIVDLVAEFEANASPKVHHLLSEWISDDAPEHHSKSSSSRIRT